MGLISRLYDFINVTQTADAEQVDAEFNQILGVLNGNIDNSNINTAANIYGSKLADSPNGVPSSKLNGVTAPNLLNDSVVGRPVKLAVWTSPVLGAYAANGGTTRHDTGLSTAANGNVLLFVYNDQADDVTGTSLLIYRFIKDSSTNTWWLRITNPSAVSIGSIGKSVKILYIPAS